MKISFPKKTLSLALIAAMGLGYSPKSEALLPTTDIANLTESIAGNIQEMYNWAEEKTMMMFEMDMAAIMEELSIDNQNNAISNLIVRSGAAMQEIQNLEVMEQSVPDKDAVDTIANQILESHALCSAQVGSKQASDASLETHCQFEESVPKQIAKRKALIDDFIQKCEGLVSSPVAEGESKIGKTMCTQSSILLGAGTLDTYTPNEAQAVLLFNQLISGVAPSLKESGKYSSGSDIKNKTLIKEMRKEALRSMVNTSLNEIAYARIPSAGQKHSFLHTLTLFDEKRYGNTTWMSTLTNVSKSQKNSVMPSEVLRKIAAMDSFLVHMSILQYKQQLRMEALQAGKLAIEVEPLD